MSEAIKIKIGSRQQQNINVSGRPNPHYITYESFQDYKTFVEENYVTDTSFQDYKNFVEENYVSDASFNSTINSLDIPRKLTDLEIDLGVVVYDPNKDYLEVVGVN